MKNIIIIFFLFITNLFSVEVLPNKLYFKDKKSTNMKLYSGSNITKGILYKIYNLEKDEFGLETYKRISVHQSLKHNKKDFNIKNTVSYQKVKEGVNILDIKNIPYNKFKSDFIFSKPMLIIKPNETKSIKVSYKHDIPKIEKVYVLEVHELLQEDSLISKIDKNIINTQKTLLTLTRTKVFIGGVKDNIRPTCIVDKNKITIFNNSTRHIYINDKNSEVLINGNNINKLLIEDGVRLLGFYLEAKSKNTRFLSKKFKKNSKCKITKKEN